MITKNKINKNIWGR